MLIMLLLFLIYFFVLVTLPHAAYVLVFIASVFVLFYISYDPLSVDGKLDPRINQIIFFIPVSCLFTVFNLGLSSFFSLFLSLLRVCSSCPRCRLFSIYLSICLSVCLSNSDSLISA